MTNLMTEKEVLDALNIKDFRHMSKDKVITAFSSMLPNMSPEVALKTLDQFPSFAQAMKDTAVCYKEVLGGAIDTTNATTKQSISACQRIIDALCKELEKDDLTFEEKRYYVEQMQQVGQLIKEIQEDHNKMILKCVVYGFLAVSAVGSCLLTGLGGNVHITIPKKFNRS